MEGTNLKRGQKLREGTVTCMGHGKREERQRVQNANNNINSLQVHSSDERELCHQQVQKT